MQRSALFTLLLAAGATMPGVALGQGPMDIAMAGPQPHFVAAWAPEKEREAEHSAALARRVSLELQNVSLDAALKALTNQAGLRITYSQAILPKGKRVTLKAGDIAVVTALTEMLFRSGLDVVVDRDGALALVVCRHRGVEAVQDSGAIVGRVTDKATGAAIVGATVTLDPKRQNVTTDNDGWYRFAGLAPGGYAVRVRSIGYAPAEAPIRVAAGEQAVLNLALERSVTILEEIVSTGTTSPAQVRDLPTPVTVIDRKDIEALQPRQLGQLLRIAVPTAVATVLSDPSRTLLSLRGASTLTPAGGEIKIYLDGIEISDRNYGAVDPSSIDRIELVRGPQAATLYGSDAIGGVMQIFTRRGDPARSQPRINAQAALGVVQSPFPESGALRQDYRLDVGGGAGQASYFLGATYGKTNDWVVEGGSVVPSAFASLRLPAGKLTVDISGRFYAQRTGAPTVPGLLTSGIPSFSQPNHQTLQSQELTLGTRLSYAAAPWWHHSFTAGVDRLARDDVQDRPRFTTPDDSLLFNSTRNTTKASIAYNSSFTGSLGRAFVGTGTIGFDHYELRNNGWFLFGARNTRGTMITDVPPVVDRNLVNNTGYFAEARLVFRYALALTGGGRFEQNSEFGDALGTPFSPRVGAAYSFRTGSADFKLRGAYGEAIRAPAPGFKDAAVTPFAVTLANPLLRPERQSGWDAGFDVVFGTRGSLSVTYFDQVAKDLILNVFVDQLAAPPVTQYQNIARARNRGLEVEGTVEIGPVQVRGQYAYTQSKAEELGPNVGGDLQVGEQIHLVPQHTGGASLTARLFRGTSVTGALSYVGSRRATDVVALFKCFGGTGPCQPTLRGYLIDYPAITRLDLTVAQQLTQQLSGFVSLENAANSARIEFVNNAAPTGRITMVGLRASL